MRKISKFMIEDLESLVKRAEISQTPLERHEYLKYYKDVKSALEIMGYDLSSIKYLEERVRKLK